MYPTDFFQADIEMNKNKASNCDYYKSLVTKLLKNSGPQGVGSLSKTHLERHLHFKKYLKVSKKELPANLVAITEEVEQLLGELPYIKDYPTVRPEVVLCVSDESEKGMQFLAAAESPDRVAAREKNVYLKSCIVNIERILDEFKQLEASLSLENTASRKDQLVL